MRYETTLFGMTGYGMTSDINSKLLNWLRATGYPFQLGVGRALQNAGWHVNYSRWYQDRLSRKSRELDLQALVGAVHPGQASLFFCLCVECKVSQNRPWVGICSGNRVSEDEYLNAAPGPMTPRFLRAATKLGLMPPRLLPDSVRLADSLVAGLTSSRDDNEPEGVEEEVRVKPSNPMSPYSALLQVVAATRAFDESMFGVSISTRAEIAAASVLLPVLLLKGRLFSYSVDSGSGDELAEVGSLLVRVPTENGDSTLVAVLTEVEAGMRYGSMYLAAHNFCVAALPHARTIADALTMPESES